MSNLFIEAFNALLQRYHFAIASGFTREEQARFTLQKGLESAVVVAYSCEDTDSAIELQKCVKDLIDGNAVPQPI
jgi:hypothetical protein